MCTFGDKEITVIVFIVKQSRRLGVGPRKTVRVLLAIRLQLVGID